MAKKTPTQRLTPADKLLASKRRLVKRLRDDIAWRRECHEADVAKIEARIRIAQVLIDALEKGTLKP